MNHASRHSAGVAGRSKRRRSIGAAYANAAGWGLGNGLANTTLVLYLAREFQASGATISWLLAAPSLAGLVRLGAPALLARVASRRRFSVAMFLASATLLATLPIISAPGVFATSEQSLVALAVTWAAYQALESIGAIALWEWLGDLVPRAVRGRFLGRREACLNFGAVAGTAASAAVTLAWESHCRNSGTPERAWQAYAACGLAGAALFAVAALVLLRMADGPRTTPTAPPVRIRWHDLITPWVDPRFRRFLAFGLWFSFSNGVVQSAQNLFMMNSLRLSYGLKKALDGGSRGLQASLLPGIGAAIDRRGNVPVLAASQALIATAAIFFLYATPLEPWWILGAYACWLAFGGHNVALPNLMLGLCPPGHTANCAAAWFAWTQLAYSLSVLSGGMLYDWLAARLEPISLGGRPLDAFVVLFAASWLLKSLGVALACRIPEPVLRGHSKSGAHNGRARQAIR
jgi:MFS family permease